MMHRRAEFRALVCCALLLIPAGASRAQLSVVFVELHNQSEERLPRLDERSEEFFYRALGRIGGLRVIDRAVLSHELLQQRIIPSLLPGSPRLAANLGRGLGADWLLSGRVLEYDIVGTDHSMEVELVVIDCHTERIVLTKHYSASTSSSDGKKKHAQLLQIIHQEFEPDLLRMIDRKLNRNSRTQQQLVAHGESKDDHQDRTRHQREVAEAWAKRAEALRTLEAAGDWFVVEVAEIYVKNAQRGAIRLEIFGPGDAKASGRYVWPSGGRKQVRSGDRISLHGEGLSLRIDPKTGWADITVQVTEQIHTILVAQQGSDLGRADHKALLNARVTADSSVTNPEGTTLGKDGDVEVRLEFRRTKAVVPPLNLPEAPQTQDVYVSSLWIEHDLEIDARTGMGIHVRLEFSGARQRKLVVAASFPFDTGLASSRGPSNRVVDTDGSMRRVLTLATSPEEVSRDLRIFVPYEDFAADIGNPEFKLRVEVAEAESGHLLTRTEPYFFLLRNR